MLPILQNKSVTTMSSREISELTGKNHFDVKRDIQNILLQAEIDASKFAVIYKDSQNRNQSEYSLPKRECDLVISGYSVKYRLAIIDRWQELEQQVVKLPDFSNPVAAARAWADAKESEQKALAQIEASKPALLVYEALANRRMDCNTTTLAKQLGTTATKLNIFLKSAGVKFKHQDLPMATHSDWFNVVTGVAKNGYETIQCLITPLGQIEIAKLWLEK